MNDSSRSIGSAIISSISRVRRNHALEHATMHVLNGRCQHLRLVGRSSIWGFHIYGEIPTSDLLAAAHEGLQRLRSGDAGLAVHPNCGTNLALAGTLGGLGAFMALWNPPRRRWDRLMRLPLAILAATLGVAASIRLGPLVQARITTQADPGRLRLVSISRERRASFLVHHIRTRDER